MLCVTEELETWVVSRQPFGRVGKDLWHGGGANEEEGKR